MSTAAATTARLAEPVVPIERPGRRLTPVVAPVRARRPKLAYALIALAGAALVAGAQIGLSLAITHDSFVLADLKSQQRELDLRTSALKDDLAGISSPQLLATKASDLGMVIAGSASYLRLSDSAVVGTNSGAGQTSTVDPRGSGAVHNALLNRNPLLATDATDETAASDAAPETGDPQLPPPITDGLPSPTTH